MFLYCTVGILDSPKNLDFFLGILLNSNSQQDCNRWLKAGVPLRKTRPGTSLRKLQKLRWPKLRKPPLQKRKRRIQSPEASRSHLRIEAPTNSQDEASDLSKDLSVSKPTSNICFSRCLILNEANLKASKNQVWNQHVYIYIYAECVSILLIGNIYSLAR